MLKNHTGNSVDAILLTSVKLITTVLSLITIRIISDKFTYSDYGTYNQALMIASTVASIIILGFTDATNYFFNKFSSDESTRREYISTIVIFQIILGTLTGIAILLLKGPIVIFMDNDALGSIIKWVAFMPLVSNLISIQQILFVSLGKSRLIAARNLFVSFFRLSVILLSVYVTKNIVTILIASFLCDIIQVLYFIRILSKDEVKISIKSYNNSLLRSILSFALPMSMFLITNSLMRDCDKYIVSYYTDPETFAVYSNASRILPFSIVIDSFTTVLLPIITKCFHEGRILNVSYIYKNYLSLSAVVSWILISGALVCANDLIIILYGSKYSIGLSIFIIYLLVSLARFANLSLIFSASGNTKIIMKISLLSLLANIVLSLVLFHYIGLVGCAAATLIITIIVDIFYLYKGSGIIKSSIFQLFEGKFLIVLILQSFVLGIIIFAIKKILVDVGPFMRFSTTYGIYILALSLLNRKKILQYFTALNKV